MERSSKQKFTERINRAFILLKKKIPQREIIQILTKEYGVSEIQAYRYTQQAKTQTELLPVPEQTKTFTIKLRHSLIDRIRSFSKSVGKPTSHVVSQALEDYLKRK